MISVTSFHADRERLLTGKVACQELVISFLDRINQYNGELNAYVEVFATEAIQRAKQIDQKIKLNQAGRLAGLVVGVKDLFAIDGHELTCGSKILNGFKSQITATSIQRLLDEDAIIIGRHNCDEFGMGSSNEHSSYGPVKNPHDTSRVPGGSSGGSAAAVAAGFCHLALGSDTGGSVRQPAAFCGIYGLKPTYGRISRYGLTAYSSSFDCVGILGNDLRDLALVLEIIAGQDFHDTTSSQQDVPAYIESLHNTNKTYTIGIYKEILQAEGMQDEVKNSFLEKIDLLKHAGHTVKTVSFPYLDYLLPTYYILTTAEASSNLSRYDGVRYGYRAPVDDLTDMYKQTRTKGFGKEVLRRILLGSFVLTSGYQDAFFTKAQRTRRFIRDKTLDVLNEVDFIMMPTAPGTAFEIGSKEKDPIEMYLADIFTVQASIAGLPAINVPIKSTSALPIGLQVMAAPFSETQLFAFSKILETI